MKTYLKHYKAVIETKAPVFIGDGTKIGKKEFIYLGRDKKVLVPDMNKFFEYLQSENLESSYTRYMLSPGNEDLGRWLLGQRVDKKEYKKFIKYTLDAGDVFLDTGGSGKNNYGNSQAKAKEISCFMKDASGDPYVPGSSIKGMIRTAVLAHEISSDRELKAEFRKKLTAALDRGNNKRNYFLKNETQELEERVFHTVERISIPKRNAVCSNMSGLIIGDSDLIDTKSLTLCQKIDYSIEKKERPLPLLREALKPGTKIYFDITIDPGICPYDIDDILAFLDEYQENIYRNFYKTFGRGCAGSKTVWLGGGCGFPTKTVIAALFDEETTKVTADIFRTTVRNYYEHKHNLDESIYGISPHVCKCTRYNNRLYDMGQCKIEILEREM